MNYVKKNYPELEQDMKMREEFFQTLDEELMETYADEALQKAGGHDKVYDKNESKINEIECPKCHKTQLEKEYKDKTGKTHDYDYGCPSCGTGFKKEDVSLNPSDEAKTYICPSCAAGEHCKGGSNNAECECECSESIKEPNIHFANLMSKIHNQKATKDELTNLEAAIQSDKSKLDDKEYNVLMAELQKAAVRFDESKVNIEGGKIEIADAATFILQAMLHKNYSKKIVAEIEQELKKRGESVNEKTFKCGCGWKGTPGTDDQEYYVCPECGARLGDANEAKKIREAVHPERMAAWIKYNKSYDALSPEQKATVDDLVTAYIDEKKSGFAKHNVSSMQDPYCDKCGSTSVKIKSENGSLYTMCRNCGYTVKIKEKVSERNLSNYKCCPCGWEGDTKTKSCPECKKTLNPDYTGEGHGDKVTESTLHGIEIGNKVEGHDLSGKSISGTVKDIKGRYVIVSTEDGDIETAGVNVNKVNERLDAYDKKELAKLPASIKKVLDKVKTPIALADLPDWVYDNLDHEAQDNHARGIMLYLDNRGFILEESVNEMDATGQSGSVASPSTYKVKKDVSRIPQTEGIEDQPDMEKAKAEANQSTKEYLGNNGAENYYYLVTVNSLAADDTSPATDVQIVDADGEVKFSAKERQLDPSDISTIIADAVKELEITNVAFELVQKYIVAPQTETEEDKEEIKKDVEAEKEEGEEKAPEDKTETPDEEVPNKSLGEPARKSNTQSMNNMPNQMGEKIDTGFYSFVEAMRETDVTPADVSRETSNVSLNEGIKDITIETEFVIPVEELIEKLLGTKWNESDDDEVYDLFNDAGLEYATKEAKKIIKKLPVKIVNVEFIEVDSSNWSHAGAYYNVTLTGSEAVLKTIAGEESDFCYTWEDEDK